MKSKSSANVHAEVGFCGAFECLGAMVCNAGLPKPRAAFNSGALVAYVLLWPPKPPSHVDGAPQCLGKCTSWGSIAALAHVVEEGAGLASLDVLR